MNTYRGVQTSPKADFYAPKSPRPGNNESQTTYPYKHKHINLFPPKARPPAIRQLSNVEEEVPIFFASSHDGFEDFSRITTRGSLEIPSTMSQLLGFPDTDQKHRLSALDGSGALYHDERLGVIKAEKEFGFPALKEYPATPPLACPPPFLFPAPQSPVCCHTPVATVTGLLEEVLTIMNTIIKEQGRVAGESEILMNLLEMATIMQEEAEALVDLVDLVEVYVEEVATASAFEADNLSIIHSDLQDTPSHHREDSGVSMGDGTDSGRGTPEEVSEADTKRSGVRNAVIIQPASKPKVEGRRQRRKGKKSREEHFRDSALDLVGPVVRSGVRNGYKMKNAYT